MDSSYAGLTVLALSNSRYAGWHMSRVAAYGSLLQNGCNDPECKVAKRDPQTVGELDKLARVGQSHKVEYWDSSR